MTDRDMVNEAREYRRRCDEERPKTLRDEIAIAVLAAGIAATSPDQLKSMLINDFIAEVSYAIADAMLRAREGK